MAYWDTPYGIPHTDTIAMIDDEVGLVSVFMKGVTSTYDL